MKFLHTADWQMGMPAPSDAAERGEQIRQARFEAARRVIETAQTRAVDFVVVAGDLFEDNAVDRVMVRRVGELLAKAHVPVYILPGNHDPWVPGSVWEHSVWSEHDDLRVLTKPEPLEVPGGLLWPTPVCEPYSHRDQTQWMDATDQESICIGVAHGNVQGGPADPELPILRDAPAKRGLDYLALGHWHSTALYEEPDQGHCRMAYSGAHEPTKFGERDSGQVLIVEIHGRRAAPVVEPVSTSVLKWVVMEREVAAGEGLETVAEEVRAMSEPDRTLLRLRLSGVFDPGASALLRDLEEVLAARFLLGRLETDGLVELPQDDSWLDDLPDELTKATAARLSELASSGQPQQRVEARMALAELFDVVGRAGR